MKHGGCILPAVFAVLVLCGNISMALDTGAMAMDADRLFGRNGMKAKTDCTDRQASITLFPGEDGKRPSVDKVIDLLAVVGKSFNRTFGADYFYPMVVYYDGRIWIETLAGNCRDSFQDNIVSRCYYKVNFR